MARRVSFLFKGTIKGNVRLTITLSYFGIQLKYKQGLKLTEVLWTRPPPQWYKVNIDGAGLGQPYTALCDGVFKISRGSAAGSFAMPLGNQTALYADIMELINVVEIAKIKDGSHCGLKQIRLH